jgi:hypothetical protein
MIKKKVQHYNNWQKFLKRACCFVEIKKQLFSRIIDLDNLFKRKELMSGINCVVRINSTTLLQLLKTDYLLWIQAELRARVHGRLEISPWGANLNHSVPGFVSMRLKLNSRQRRTLSGTLYVCAVCCYQTSFDFHNIWFPFRLFSWFYGKSDLIEKKLDAPQTKNKWINLLQHARWATKSVISEKC